MHFKLIITFSNEHLTDKLLDSSRKSGATGATVINKAHGEGVVKNKKYLV